MTLIFFIIDFFLGRYCGLKNVIFDANKFSHDKYFKLFSENSSEGSSINNLQFPNDFKSLFGLVIFEAQKYVFIKCL